MKPKIAIFVIGGFLVALLVMALRNVPSKRTAQKATEEAPRPSPLDEHLPRLPMKIVEIGESVRTRTANAPKDASKDAQPQPKVAESFEKVSGTNWAVVAAIYREYEAAERRARSMAQNPKFHPTVFPDKGKGVKYMVVLGSGLTRAKAEDLRVQAASAGLPSDTYVTKLSP
jgi:hypothetical protein